MNPEVFVKAVESILIQTVHTIKPCIINSVDYTKNQVNVKPLTSTLYQDNIAIGFDEIRNVPILVNSANAGNAAITFPIKKGDMCLVLFSDRNYSGLLDESELIPQVPDDRSPFGINPIGALVGIFTVPNATEIDPDNVVIRNGKSKITVKPDGDIDIESEVNVNVVANEVTVDSPNTTMTGNLQVDGNINCNNTVTADTNVVGGGISVNSHTHNKGYEDQPTDPPNP